MDSYPDYSVVGPIWVDIDRIDVEVLTGVTELVEYLSQPIKLKNIQQTIPQNKTKPHYTTMVKGDNSSKKRKHATIEEDAEEVIETTATNEEEEAPATETPSRKKSRGNKVPSKFSSPKFADDDQVPTQSEPSSTGSVASITSDIFAQPRDPKRKSYDIATYTGNFLKLKGAKKNVMGLADTLFETDGTPKVFYAMGTSRGVLEQSLEYLDLKFGIMLTTAPGTWSKFTKLDAELAMDVRSVVKKGSCTTHNWFPKQSNNYNRDIEEEAKQPKVIKFGDFRPKNEPINILFKDQVKVMEDQVQATKGKCRTMACKIFFTFREPYVVPKQGSPDTFLTGVNTKIHKVEFVTMQEEVPDKNEFSIDCNDL